MVTCVYVWWAVALPHLHISVWCTDGRKWKTWLLTARLCSSLKGSRTTPSLTGNVSRSSSLWLAARAKKQRLDHRELLNCSDFLTGGLTNLEGEEEWWYLVWCQEGRAASRPGLATGTVGCCYPASLEVLGCLAPGSEGSSPPVWVAVLKEIDQNIR